MPDVGRVVEVRRSTKHAILRVRRVLERQARMSRVVDAEAQRVLTLGSELCNDGIVGVHDQRGTRWKRVDRGTPSFRHDLELAIAVELVAKEVPERHDLWLRASEDLR